jgi:aspartate ammonia-lyase
LGGTAVGTGLGSPRRFIFRAAEILRELTGLGLSRGENLLDATANTDPLVEVSGILKAHAGNLIKIAGDMRLLHFLGEIELPGLQPGSSIMPGKVNPVLMEALIQTGLKVMANDFLVAEACSRASLQINEFLPLVAHSLLESLDILTRANRLLCGHIAGISAREEKCGEYFSRSPMIVTALLPHIGYEKALSLLEEFKKSGREDMREFLAEKMGKEFVRKALSPYQLTALGYREDEKNP